MCKFIRVGVSDKTGKQLEDLRINCSDIKSYRRWLNNTGTEQTILFYKNGDELIVDSSVEYIDSLTGGDVLI